MNTTKETLQVETGKASKQRGCSFWIIRFAFLIGLTVLAYYGYCWGLWGRGSLLLQYLFQCSCLAASEEARYPRQVEVIVSACKYVSSRLSPSGRLLLVSEKKNESSTDYLLDLQTMEKIDVTNHPDRLGR
jgi:hypothetical protein